jgi:hypothetical protein
MQDGDEESSLSENDEDHDDGEAQQDKGDQDFVAEDVCDPLVDDGPETGMYKYSQLTYYSHVCMTDDDEEEEEEEEEPPRRASSLPASPSKRNRSASPDVRT